MSLRITKGKLIRLKRVSGGKSHSHPSPALTSLGSQRANRTDSKHKASTFTRPGSPSPPLLRARAGEQAAGLTYEIRQQDGQEEGRGDGGQGRAFPAAVLGGLLQLEGLPGEGVPGQQAGWRRVNGS